MKKNFIFLAAATLAAACSSNQTPAPYEVYGTRFYGKNGPAPVYAGNNGSSNHPILQDNGPSNSYSLNDYNRQIDEQNSNSVVSHPLNAQKTGEVYSHQNADSSGISGHPLAPVPIDGNQQVVRIAPSNQSIHSGGSIGGNYAMQNDNYYHPPVAPEAETVPPVENKENFVNPSQVNADRKSTDILAKVKPMAKPKQQEEAETETVQPAPVQPATTKPAAAAKPKITPKIEKIETSSGEIDKSTPAMINKPQAKLAPAQAATAEEDDNSAADDSEKAADEKPLVSPPKNLGENKPAAKANTDENADSDDSAESVTPAPVAVAKTASSKGGPQFIKPVDGVVIGEFGNDKNGGSFNDGINIQAPEGTPVKAASAGTVVYAGNQLQGYGNMIIIKHPNGFLSAYSHLKEIDLKKGQAVSQGDVVGHVGKTGNVETPQLHFGLRKGREPVDPKDYL